MYILLKIQIQSSVFTYFASAFVSLLFLRYYPHPPYSGLTVSSLWLKYSSLDVCMPCCDSSFRSLLLYYCITRTSLLITYEIVPFSLNLPHFYHYIYNEYHNIRLFVYWLFNLFIYSICLSHLLPRRMSRISGW